jgi:hypothetical protein
MKETTNLSKSLLRSSHYDKHREDLKRQNVNHGYVMINYHKMYCNKLCSRTQSNIFVIALCSCVIKREISTLILPANWMISLFKQVTRHYPCNVHLFGFDWQRSKHGRYEAYIRLYSAVLRWEFSMVPSIFLSLFITTTTTTTTTSYCNWDFIRWQ